MTRPGVVTLRWHVRRELVRDQMFGEQRRTGLKWVVRAYFPRPNHFKGYVNPHLQPPAFNTLEEAADYARKLCDARYGRQEAKR